MLEATLACLFSLVLASTLLSLADSWLHATGAYRGLMRQRALLDGAMRVQGPVEQPGRPSPGLAVSARTYRGLRRLPVRSRFPAAPVAVAA